MITLSLGRRRLFASGRVRVTDGYTACGSFVPVVIKRFRHGQWRWVVTLSTRRNGTFSGPLPDRPGLYRAKARVITLANGAICGVARSNIVHHRRATDHDEQGTGAAVRVSVRGSRLRPRRTG
jgi:hypothetical protein